MFEFLIVLAIATVCVLGWIGGNLFVCVFLSLPVAALTLLAATADGPAAGGFAMAGVFLLVGIWLPFIIRRASHPVYGRQVAATNREQEIAHARYVEEKRVAEANAAGAKAYRERWGHMSWRLP